MESYGWIDYQSSMRNRCTVGGVKAALNRGRSKLAASPVPVASHREVSPELSRLLHLYVDRFNKRDWEGLRELIRADARLRVAEHFAGAPYPGPLQSRNT